MFVVYLMLLILFPDGEMLVFFRAFLCTVFNSDITILAGVETADAPP